MLAGLETFQYNAHIWNCKFVTPYLKIKNWKTRVKQYVILVNDYKKLHSCILVYSVKSYCAVGRNLKLGEPDIDIQLVDLPI